LRNIDNFFNNIKIYVGLRIKFHKMIKDIKNDTIADVYYFSINSGNPSDKIIVYDTNSAPSEYISRMFGNIDRMEKQESSILLAQMISVHMNRGGSSFESHRSRNSRFLSTPYDIFLYIYTRRNDKELMDMLKSELEKITFVYDMREEMELLEMHLGFIQELLEDNIKKFDSSQLEEFKDPTPIVFGISKNIQVEKVDTGVTGEVTSKDDLILGDHIKTIFVNKCHEDRVSRITAILSTFNLQNEVKVVCYNGDKDLLRMGTMRGLGDKFTGLVKPVPKNLPPIPSGPNKTGQ